MEGTNWNNDKETRGNWLNVSGIMCKYELWCQTNILVPFPVNYLVNLQINPILQFPETHSSMQDLFQLY
jgi:hypothetical protein